MRHFFHIALQKYYKRQKNRIIFTNGMTLNQIALAMWEKLGFEEVDASVISRVIHGERLFSFSQLAIFCDLIEIPQKERNMLFEALIKDIAYKSERLQNILPQKIYKFNTVKNKNTSNSIENKLSKESASLFKNLKTKLIPIKGEKSLTGLPFSSKSYYPLIHSATKNNTWALNEKFAGFDVSIPHCCFLKTTHGLENNCKCGYHLCLYGVIKNTSFTYRFSKQKTQNEINQWISFFFPEETILCYLKTHQKNIHYRRLFHELHDLL